MPMKKTNGKWELSCINADEESHLGSLAGATTMVAASGTGWCVMREVEPKTIGGQQVVQELGTGFTARIFYCRICGYVEMYTNIADLLGAVVDQSSGGSPRSDPR